MRAASFLTFPSPPLNYRSYMGTTNPRISKAEIHRDCSSYLSVEGQLWLHSSSSGVYVKSLVFTWVLLIPWQKERSRKAGETFRWFLKLLLETGTLPFPIRLAKSHDMTKPDTGEVGKYTPTEANMANLMTTGRDVSFSYREGERK